MIKDKLVNIDKYKINDAFERFKKIMSESKNLDEIEAPFKAIPLEYETKSFDVSKFENHQKYIDIHYIISGSEQIGLARFDDIKPNMEYNEQNDYQLFDGALNETIELKEGEFLILFEHEPHVAGGKVNEFSSSVVKKIVYKIPVN
ncbi:YhcH/YjgK/YiaL family protein [Psychroflexus salis]|uniref:YhcH/YjgK/YiaL family protein n=1 Tax=Psychroflexus salis TaxID=1526574 RepID=A0A917E8V4_9FLAO|nr:YhcH/YjgK/YiaL family protein [Psychroflexus salis]GGE10741.1 hypothetical protein GCM10010831_10270 [Psychroflexus salis]